MSRFVVTGGAGFVGSHLTDRLLGEGHSVVVVDNLVTSSQKNIEHLKNESRFEFFQANVSKGFPDVGAVDGVLHFASPASPVDFVPLALEIMQVGSQGTLNALEYAHKHNCWFFMASTSEVYGDPQVHPQTEDYLGNVNPIGVRGVYDEAKRFSEALTMTYHRRHKLATSIVRIFNTYGPRMRPDDGRAIPNFVSQALAGEPLTVYGDGSQTRSLCYVADLVDGLVRFAQMRPVEPVNLGNNREITMMELARRIITVAGSASEIQCKPLPEGDPKKRCPVIDRAKRVLKWTPSTTLEQGLKETVQHFRSLINAGV